MYELSGGRSCAASEQHLSSVLITFTTVMTLTEDVKQSKGTGMDLEMGEEKQ